MNLKKNKSLVILGVITLGIFLACSYNLTLNNSDKLGTLNKEKEISNPFVILGENSLALTLNGKPTDLTYSELMNTKVVNTITCENGTTATFNESDNSITLTNIQIPDYCTIDFKDKTKVTFYNQLLADHSTRLTRTGFSAPFIDENTKTLYTVDGNWTEGGNTVYYFAGNALDNWIKFGKNSSGADLYWRIIRTNEDGSVRLLYVGTSMDTTEGYISENQVYNISNDPMYVGYMYGTSGSLPSNRNNTTSSSIKTTIDTWYNGSINAKTDALGNKYDKYVSRTAIYCNDRAHGGTYTTVNTTFYYAGYYRLTASNSSYANTGTNGPSYKCGNNVSGTLYGNSSIDDRFSASKNTTNGVTVGNGKLKYPVALITADELSFAGGLWQTNSQSWYYYNSVGGSVIGDKWWWTMTPAAWFTGYSYMFFMHGSRVPGSLQWNDTAVRFAVRPVLSLKSCTSWVSGDGSVNNPYEVTIDNTCASREN